MPGEPEIPELATVVYATSFGTFELAGTPATQVPETASGALLGIGMLALAIRRRRRAKSKGI
jgi:hypothetical protein